MTSTRRGLDDGCDLDAVFAALAHQSRRTILSVLLARGGEILRAIGFALDCAWPTTTRHLRVLEDAGLVRVELRGVSASTGSSPSDCDASPAAGSNRFAPG